MDTDREQRSRLAEQLYEEHGKPLEQVHFGEFLAVSREGNTVVGPDLRKVLRQARLALGPGSFVFKVGERAVWNWR